MAWLPIMVLLGVGMFLWPQGEGLHQGGDAALKQAEGRIQGAWERLSRVWMSLSSCSGDRASNAN